MTTASARRPSGTQLQAIRNVLAEPRERPPHSLEGCAVLAPLVPTAAGLYLLYERRPLGAGRFAGHLGFPGGRIEPEDATPLAAALREAEEEVGFHPSEVEVLGHLTDTTDPVGREVACYVGVVPLEAIPAHAASPDEVAELILVPVADLLAPDRRHDAADGRPPHAYRATDHHARVLPSEERFVQYWHLEGVHVRREATLWGFTAGLTALLFNRAFDWSPPHPPRIVQHWDDLLP